MDFLHYVEATDDESAANTDSERIKAIHACVSRIKASEEMGVKYMQSWEEKIYERQEGRSEGKAEGKAEDILELLSELGPVPEELRQIIMGQKDLEVLKVWLKLAARAGSLEEFRKQTGG